MILPIQQLSKVMCDCENCLQRLVAAGLCAGELFAKKSSSWAGRDAGLHRSWGNALPDEVTILGNCYKAVPECYCLSLVAADSAIKPCTPYKDNS